MRLFYTIFGRLRLVCFVCFFFLSSGTAIIALVNVQSELNGQIKRHLKCVLIEKPLLNYEYNWSSKSNQIDTDSMSHDFLLDLFSFVMWRENKIENMCLFLRRYINKQRCVVSIHLCRNSMWEMTFNGKHTNERYSLFIAYMIESSPFCISKRNKLAYLLQINADYRKLSWTTKIWNETIRSVSLGWWSAVTGECVYVFHLNKNESDADFYLRAISKRLWSIANK